MEAAKADTQRSHALVGELAALAPQLRQTFALVERLERFVAGVAQAVRVMEERVAATEKEANAATRKRQLSFLPGVTPPPALPPCVWKGQGVKGRGEEGAGRWRSTAHPVAFPPPRTAITRLRC